MKRIIFLFTIVFLITNNAPSLFAQMVFSGVMDTSVSMQAGAGINPDFSCGMEQFANIRFQSRFRDNGRIEGAVNLFAVTGDYAANAAWMADYKNTEGITPPGLNATPLIAGENYAAGLELERLFFRLNFEKFDLDGGLMRVPFGYSHVWGSMDFLNPPNPLKPDSRPRGVMGSVLTWHLTDNLKIAGFGVTPRDPLTRDGSGGFVGITAEQSYVNTGFQGLYSYEMPDTGSKFGIHRVGLSVKADIEANFIIDALYTYNHEIETALDGLSFNAGVDYSLFSGDLFVLVEYLYNGSSSSTARNFGGFLSNEHYLSANFTWMFDFTSISLALICGLNDISFLPVLSVNYELFQGANLSVIAQFPMDRDLFAGNGKFGELGPAKTGNYFNLTTRFKFRF